MDPRQCLPGGRTLLNAEIVRQANGFAYTQFPFRHLEEFRKLEQEAWEARWEPWRVRYENRRIAMVASMEPQGVASLDELVLGQPSELEAMRNVLEGKGLLTNLEVLEKIRRPREKAVKAN